MSSINYERTTHIFPTHPDIKLLSHVRISRNTISEDELLHLT